MVDYWLAAGRCPDLDTRVVYHDTGDASQASPWGEGCREGGEGRVTEALNMLAMSKQVRGGSQWQRVS